ncbi:MAG: 16S rRNA (cytidine(1402)-2'-O)-methyltransferase [Acidimicrobiia bacterium]|nr:MAG: 16S rRNA (cytidine(1402)-2'-O)-methyltransferase [Acidimicrobiia bacterium]
MTGKLTLCGTPIGNLGDLSERAAKALESADLVFAEDTRRTAQLLAHLGVSVPMKSFFAGNERARLDLLRSELEAGTSVVLVSDAGMPVISDPGASAINAAVEVGAEIAVVPGPSAVSTALSVSGFSGDRFVFDGFLPRKGRDRARAIQSIASEQRTTVIFASPKRVVDDLSDLADELDADRRLVVARELTKVFEEVWRGTIGEASQYWESGGTTKGEFTVVIEGARAIEMSIDEAADAVRALIAQGSSTSDAVRTIATAHDVSRRDLYDRILKDRSDLLD